MDVQKTDNTQSTHIFLLSQANRPFKSSFTYRIVNRNICAEYGLDPPKFRREPPQKVVEKNRAKLLRDVQIQIDRKVLASQPDMVEGGRGDRRSSFK